MNKKKKYSLLTSADIEEGLKNNRFLKEEISLIRDEEGKIVRHLPQTNFQDKIIPPTLIQINSTYIVQADIKPIIEALIETRNIELLQDLLEKHQIVIDSLIYYKDHNSRLDELNEKTLDASAIFETRVIKYLSEVEVDNIEKIDIKSCITMLDSYLNVMFVYLISLYWIHNERISNDTITKRKIEDLEHQVRYIYEQLLAKSWLDDKKTKIIPMNNSVYGMLLLEEENGIIKIEKFIEHDLRFSTITDFFSFIQRCFFKKNNRYYQGEDETYEININLTKTNEHIIKKLEFAQELFNVLEKINLLKNISSELMKAGKIDLSTIEIANIPLSLHPNSNDKKLVTK